MTRSVTLALPTFGFILATRAALAFGVALLVSPRIPEARRRAIGIALATIGVATTIPAVRALRAAAHRAALLRSSSGQDHRLVGTERFPRKGDDEI
jgi:hypothetical protein